LYRHQCLVMYAAAKLALYVGAIREQGDDTNHHRALFLLERVRIVRAPFLERSRDYIWITGAVTTICGYPALLCYELVRPRAVLSREDGICRIGALPVTSETMMAFDVAINVTFTVAFVWQLRKLFSSPITQSPSTGGLRRTSLHPLPVWEKYGLSTGRTSSENNLRLMLIRNVIGSVLILITTVTNVVTFLTRGFAMMAHACLLMCLTDSKSKHFR
jgi:hypothetical protein